MNNSSNVNANNTVNPNQTKSYTNNTPANPNFSSIPMQSPNQNLYNQPYNPTMNQNNNFYPGSNFGQFENAQYMNQSPHAFNPYNAPPQYYNPSQMSMNQVSPNMYYNQQAQFNNNMGNPMYSNTAPLTMNSTINNTNQQNNQNQSQSQNQKANTNQITLEVEKPKVS